MLALPIVLVDPVCIGRSSASAPILNRQTAKQAFALDVILRQSSLLSGAIGARGLAARLVAVVLAESRRQEPRRLRAHERHERRF